MSTENLHQSQDDSIPIPTKIIQTRYDYYNLLQVVEQRGQSIYGSKYTIHEVDRQVVLKLLCYFVRDEAVAPSEGIDLAKGIMLRGPVGCGKTSLMNIMRSLCPEDYRPVIVGARDVAMEFSRMGYDVMQKYGREAFYPYTSVPRVHCFDDLGLEQVTTFWGNSCNVMAEVLLTRYDLFVSHKMITHVTTNLNSGELEGRYGDRVRSRMREMFNLVVFNETSVDKRT